MLRYVTALSAALIAAAALVGSASDANAHRRHGCCGYCSDRAAPRLVPRRQTEAAFAAGFDRTLPVGIVSPPSRAATGTGFRHAVGQTGARPMIFRSAVCGPSWQNWRISDLSSV